MYLVFGLLLSLAITAIPGSTVPDQIFDSFGAVNCEDEMARLDNLAIAIQNSPDSRVYIVVYGGRRDTKRDEVKIRSARMKRYMVENRSISPEKIEMIDGGYRETFIIELWIVPAEKPAPAPRPTVNPKAVRFKKGKMERYREPGCFPGKYLVN